MKFVDPILQYNFEKKGYVIVDFLETSDIEKLKAVYKEFPVKKVADFQVSNYEKDVNKNRKIDIAIKDILKHKITAVFTNYKLLTGFFYIKFTGKDTAFYIHKDWNIVDESKYTSMHIWIPLENTTRKNGNLFFCPFDYKKQQTYRGSPGFEFPAPNKLTQIINRFYKVDIFTNVGQAIIFDHKLTHGSRINETNNNRVVAGISLIPKEAQMLHYNQNKAGEITRHEVNEDFYLDFNLDSIKTNGNNQ